MKLSELLKPEYVRIGLKGSSKEEILLELSDFMASVHPSVKPKDVYDALSGREEKGSTALTLGLAVPHGRSSEVTGMHLVVVYDSAGKDFDSSDGLPSKLFFTVIAADSYSPHEQLEILRVIAEIYEKTDLGNKIQSVKNEQDFYDLLIHKEEEIS